MTGIRVIHIVGSSKYGGGALVILPLAIRARREGWHVDILTTDPVFQQKIREADAGVGIVDLDVLWREIRPLRDFAGLVRLTRYLRHHPYTMVHTHTSKAGVIGRVAAKLAGVPVIVHTVHGFAFHEASSRAARFIYSGIERIAAHFCDALICVSRFHRDWALKLHIGTPEKVVAIPNGLAPDRLRVTKSRVQIRAELGLRGDEYAIFTRRTPGQAERLRVSHSFGCEVERAYGSPVSSIDRRAKANCESRSRRSPTNSAWRSTWSS